MYIIPEKNSNGAYPAPLITKAKGLLYLPDSLRDTFFKYNGFVTLTVEGDTITAVKANTKAWEAWKASRTEDEKPVTEMEQLRADVDYIAVMTGVEL